MATMELPGTENLNLDFRAAALRNEFERKGRRRRTMD